MTILFKFPVSASSTSVFLECPSVVNEDRANDITNVHLALKLVFGCSQSLPLFPILALILKVMSAANTNCSKDASETQNLSSPLGRASLLLLQPLSYRQGVQLRHKALCTS